MFYQILFFKNFSVCLILNLGISQHKTVYRIDNTTSLDNVAYPSYTMYYTCP